MRTDEAYYDRALGRIRLAILWLGLCGAAAALLLYSWRHGLGFLAGALASLANFRWLHQLAASLGEGGRRLRRRVMWFLVLRYLLLGAAGYVIVRIFGLNLAAALAGLFVAVAAVIIEIIYELIYARA
ncbi:MAG: ATP synthase subunit I [Bryobacterales bacterium]|nr:ATP synthase subunit I [Bryobacterales bacterium]